MNDGNTFSYGKLVEEGQRRLAAAGVEEAAVDAWLLFSYDKKVDRTWYLLNRTKAASGEEQEAYLKLIARRCERVPLQHITGEQEFMGLPFRVTRMCSSLGRTQRCWWRNASDTWHREMFFWICVPDPAAFW